MERRKEHEVRMRVIKDTKQLIPEFEFTNVGKPKVEKKGIVVIRTQRVAFTTKPKKGKQ